ncbi:MAG: thiamine pyrophosphate-binding protein [Geminicoccaceae bacterium]
MPVIVVHGDRDATVHPGNGAAVIRQAVPERWNRGRAPDACPAATPGPRTRHLDPAGQTLASTGVHGLGHAWSGGNAAGSYTDPRGPVPAAPCSTSSSAIGTARRRRLTTCDRRASARRSFLPEEIPPCPPARNANRAADLLARRLAEAGCRFAFGIPGGEILTLIDALAAAGITFVTTKHETAAGFMAEAVWQRTGTPPVLVATVGPGISNAVNVVANARLDRVPLIVLVGAVDADDSSPTTTRSSITKSSSSPPSRAPSP